MSLRDPSSIPERRPLGLSIETTAADLHTGRDFGAVETGWVWLRITDRNQTIVHNVLVREEEVAEEVAVAVKRFVHWERDLIAAATS